MSTLDRRRFMGGALTFSAVSGAASASTVLAAEQVLGARHQAVVVYRSGEPAAEAFARQLADAGLQSIALQEDIVRQWREGLGDILLNDRQLLLGMGHWSDCIQLQGLAAEGRHHSLLTLQHAGQQAAESHWGAAHADELLALIRLPTAEQLGNRLASLAGRGELQSSMPVLFSWIIG